MKPQYSQICGITRQELVDTFTPELIKTNPLSFNDTVKDDYFIQWISFL